MVEMHKVLSCISQPSLRAPVLDCVPAFIGSSMWLVIFWRIEVPRGLFVGRRGGAGLAGAALAAQIEGSRPGQRGELYIYTAPASGRHIIGFLG